MNQFQTSTPHIGGLFTPTFTAQWSPQRRSLVIAAIFALYILSFFAIYPTLNTESILIGSIPVLTAAWLFGMGGSLWALFVTLVISAPLVALAGEGEAVWQVLTTTRVAVELLFIAGFCLVVGRLRDLTVQVQRQLAGRQVIEEELRSNQISLVTAQQLAHVGSWEWEIASNRVSWSDQLYRIYGLQPQEIPISFEGYLARVLPADRDKVIETIQRAHQDAQPFHFYERIVQPNQHIRTLYSHGEVKVDETGKPVRMVGACQDVTELKLSETQILRREGILYAVAFAASQFLQSATWLESLDVVLASLGHAVDANQILIFENSTDDPNRLLSSVRYQWTMPGYRPHINREEWQTFSLAETGFGRWAKLMEQGESAHGAVSTFPEDEQQLLASQKIEALVVMPIYVGEKWWGFIGVDYSQSESQWSLAEVEAFKTATRLLGAALYRQESIEEIHRQAARAHSLMETASRLNAQLDMQSVLRTVCEEAIVALGVPVGTISLYDEDQQTLRYAYGSGVPDDFARRVKTIRAPGNARNGQVGLVEHREGLVITYDVQEIPSLTNAELYAEMKLRTTINVTLQREGRLIGRLNIGTTDEPRKFSEDDLALLKGLADHAVTALENARLYEESQRQAALLEAVNTIITTVVLAPDIPNLLETSLQHILPVLELSIGMIWASGHSATAGLDDEVAAWLHTLTPNDGMPAHSDEWQVTNWYEVAVDAAPPAIALVIHRVGLGAAFFIPLSSEGQVVGGILVGQHGPRAWNADEITLMRAVGQQLNAAIERLDLRKREQEQARRVQQILEIALEGMLLLDAEQRVILANPAARKYLPWLTTTDVHEPLTHLGPLPIATLLHASTTPLHWQEITIDAPQRLIFEIMARSLADQSLVDREKSDHAKDAEYNAQGYVLVLRDVTQERQRHEYLQTQERLATVGQLAAGIAHDFNNMLTPILLYTEMSMARLPGEHRVQNNLQQIFTAATRAKELIFQILAFGRHGAKQGRKVLHLQPIVKETLKLLRAVLPSTISIEQKIGAGIGAVFADATQIHQVLMNLCTNAHHAMQTRGGVLKVELEVVDIDSQFAARHVNLKPGRYVRLSVSDTGYGMDRATLAHIFDPFFTTKAVGEGTGMGLAVVYGVVMAHEGAITVESHPGRGSTFQIYLAEITQEVDEEDTEGQATIHGEGKILVVDDEETVAQVVKESLESIGYTVTLCTDSTDALNLFRANPTGFDLVLSDLTMPRMTGIELVRNIVRVRPGIPIILASGYSSDFTHELTTELGVRAYLMKPFAQNVLSQTVRQVLEGRATLPAT